MPPIAPYANQPNLAQHFQVLRDRRLLHAEADHNVPDGALVIRQPIYGFFSWTGYIWAWRLLRGNWRFVGVAAAALVTAISQTGSGPYRNASEIKGDHRGLRLHPGRGEQDGIWQPLDLIGKDERLRRLA